MSDTVLVAIIGGPIVGIIVGLFQFLNNKANRVDTKVATNTEEVKAAREAVATVREASADLRIELDRKNTEIEVQQKQIKQLEMDLAEERAITISLLRELRKGKGDGPK